MCKIFSMTNVSKIDVDSKLLSVIRDAVCKSVDKDGFGYAVSSKDGQLWGERTTNPFNYKPLDEANRSSSKTKELVIVDTSVNTFGIPSKQNLALIAHGRMSTNTISIQNTHPFVSESIALVHNGVVSDYDNVVKDQLKTDCDTEILLRLWEMDTIDAIEQQAAGYYALTLLDSVGQLHVIRDDRANLHVAYSETVDSYLFATTIEILEDISKAMQWTIDQPERVKDNVYAIFQGNEVVYHQEIFPLGYVSNFDDSKVANALGEPSISQEISESELQRYYDSSVSNDDAPWYKEETDYTNLKIRKAK